MKYFRSLDKEKVIKIFEDYRESHGEYPTTNDIVKLKRDHKHTLPSVKWIQRHGGITPFFLSLGLHYLDARTGARRATIATSANKKAQSLDIQFSKQLISRFGEDNVHWQSPYNKVTLHRSDFKIYTSKGDFFFLDLFFPQDIMSLVGCVNLKLKKLSVIPIEGRAMIYFVCCNEETISPYLIQKYIKGRKSPFPKNVKLLHISEALDMLPK